MTILSSIQSHSGAPYDLPILANHAESKLCYKFHMFLLCCMYSTNWLKPRYTESRLNRNTVDPSHRSHQYPAMCRFITDMCTHVHISVAGWYSGIIELVHCGTCTTGILHVLCLVSYTHTGYVIKPTRPNMLSFSMR